MGITAQEDIVLLTGGTNSRGRRAGDAEGFGTDQPSPTCGHLGQQPIDQLIDQPIITEFKVWKIGVACGLKGFAPMRVDIMSQYARPTRRRHLANHVSKSGRGTANIR